MPLRPRLAIWEARLRRLLAIAAAVELLAALYALTLGGFDWRFGPLRISAGSPFRPFVTGAICASLAIWLRDRASPGRIWDQVRSWSGVLAFSCAAMTLVVGLWFAAPAAGASDPYGYVSEALLWAKGNLFVQEPLATIDPVIARAAAPLGYQLEPPDVLVPRYSPGLPIVMAMASVVGGERSVYFVVPLLGALAVWLTYRLGHAVAGPRTGLVAAIALTTSPIFLYQLFLPMADLAAATWWLAAIVIGLSEARGAALLAGAASALAVMTRPNLLPLALPVAILIALNQPRKTRLALFGLGLLPACLGIALFNRALYGSVMLSGYGSLDTLFHLEWIKVNLQRYPRWLVDLHSVLVLIGLAAPFARRRTGEVDVDRGVLSAALTLALLAYCFSVVACYIAYVPFDGWQFLRFWLPALPVLLVLSSSVVLRLISTLPLTTRTACVIALCSLGAAWSVDKAYRLGSFYVSREERRYLTIGYYLRRALPDNAVILAGLHSGSLRLYGGHRTLRWDQFRPRDLDRAVTLLEASGYAPFVLVEREEEMLFRDWFGPSEILGKLDWPPAYEYLGHQNARVYSFEERKRPRSPGVLPKPIPED